MNKIWHLTTSNGSYDIKPNQTKPNQTKPNHIYSYA